MSRLVNGFADYRQQHTCRRSGFTMIELLVVVAIILIIAGLVSPAVYKMTRDSNARQASAQVRSIDAAIKNFKAEYGRWPGQVSFNNDRNRDGIIRQHVLIQDLTSETTRNPRNLRFLDVDESWIGGPNTNRYFIDPWLNMMVVVMDDNDSGKLEINTNITVYIPNRRLLNYRTNVLNTTVGVVSTGKNANERAKYILSWEQ